MFVNIATAYVNVDPRERKKRRDFQDILLSFMMNHMNIIPTHVICVDIYCHFYVCFMFVSDCTFSSYQRRYVRERVPLYWQLCFFAGEVYMLAKLIC